MENFRAYRIDQQDGKIIAGFTTLNTNDLSEGNVVIRVSHSTINYKDALAATGGGRILRKFPLVGGIDLAGAECEESAQHAGDADHGAHRQRDAEPGRAVDGGANADAYALLLGPDGARQNKQDQRK